MTRKEEFTYRSRDRETDLHAIRWSPESDPVAILQIVHGMQEYIDRYDEFARFMNDRGILVTGNDHLGHGKSADGKQLGYFCKNDPATVLVRDVHRLKKMTQDMYPGVPVIILGHSFGSFVVREYLTRYGTGIQGAIIQGTGMVTDSALGFMKFVANVQGFFCGQKHPSKLIAYLCFKDYLKRIPDHKTMGDWLSHNDESIKAYGESPYTQGYFSVNGFKTLGELMQRGQNMDHLEDIPKDLPILITSGTEDPVGHYGEDVKKLYDIYKDKLGIKNTELKFYEGYRHELQQEIGREQVFEDQYQWIKKVADF